ncbi:MAG TPA: DUF4139 domain-containing protein [Armatimonadota bacterium]|nr:DUF4139 domain-containing protein [Armatimonadota bacterium]
MRLMIVGLCIALVVSAASASDLPLTRVVLFSSGVGFFQHAGTVQGDTTVAMSFRVEQINDILKSMVLQDRGGGTIGPVTYAPQDPLERTLESFAVDISGNPSLGDLLESLRGAMVEITAEKAVTGKVLGREWQEKSVGDNTLRFEVINLDTEQGIVQVPVWQMKFVRLLDRELAADLDKALAAISANRDVSKRQVQLSFMGAGDRPVSVGYLLETPVWKTTYRLVVDDNQSFLQGWAIVENTTDEDWKGVNLALVSGRPISFTQNLYEPLYVSRPDVPVQVQAAAAPRVFEGAVEEMELLAEAPAPSPPAMAARAATGAAGAVGPAGAAGGGRGSAMRDNSLMVRGLAQAGVQAAATGGEVGELFQYAIDMPVSVARQESAMIPIVNQAMQAEKVSIFSAASDAVHPMNGLRLKNTTGLHLMGGPITVFDGGAYAGDALMEDLGQGDERLISYAMDLGVEVVRKSEATDRPEMSMKIVKGVLITTSKQVSKISYTVKNRTDEPRVVLIEHPMRDQWKLIEPAKADEETRSLYRFRVEVGPDKTETLTVSEEMPVVQRVYLTSEGLDQVAVYMRAQTISDSVKAALAKIVEMKTQIADIDRQIKEKEDRLTQIGTEQERIRQNMEQLDHDNDLYKKYVTKLTEQEDEFDKVRGEVAALKTQRDTAQKAMEDFIANLSVE